jgi:hypothetical protein
MKAKIGRIPFDETKKVELKKMPRLTLVKPGDGNDPNHSKPGRPSLESRVNVPHLLYT